MLILAVFAPELAPFSDRLRPRTHAVGVGLVAAAHATTALLAAQRASGVVLVGSCGVYPSDEGGGAVGSIIAAEQVVLVDAATAQDQGAVPGPMKTRAETDRALLARFTARGIASGVVATTLGITTSDGLAERIAAHSAARFENLEAFAVVEACAAAQVPCAVVLGVTNVVGSQGRGQWLANHVAIAERVARAVEETLADVLSV